MRDLTPRYLIIGAFIIFTLSGKSADWVSQSLYPAKYDSTLYEINKIEFIGNESVDDDFLKSIIKSKEVEKGLVFSFLDAYTEEAKKNPYTPEIITSSLEENLETYQKDIVYFSESYVIQDSTSLFNYYNKQGYHLVKIKKRFYPDTNKRINVLEFAIQEGERFKVGDFKILGLDKLSQRHKNNVSNLKKPKQNEFFQEDLVMQTGSNIKRYLRNNGFKYAEFSLERVVMDRDQKKDSITLNIFSGDELLIGKTDLIHLKFENKKISDKILRKMIAWEDSSLYRIKEIEKTQQNLFDLGVFNSVKIQTSNYDSLNNIIDFDIILEYRDQKDFKIGAGINRTDDNFTNLEGSAEVTHQNIFGGAQIIKPSFNIIYRDINDLNNSRANTGRKYIFEWGNGGLPQPDEYALGLYYLEHSLTTIGDARIMLELKPKFSLRRIFNDFNIRRISVPINFPVKFKTNLDLSQLNFKLLFESEKTINFESVTNFDNPEDDIVQQRLLEANITYSQLDDFGNEKGQFPITTIGAGISATKDERDNNFYPTKGFLIDLQIDANLPGEALSKYIRTLFDALFFHKINDRLVLGTKFKTGYIWFYNADNNYVALDKQFYAGGANSIRGWAARKLRYTSYYDSALVETGQVGFLENYVGSTTLMELSVELRYDLKKPKYANDVLSSIIGESNVTFYLDGGNAFNWLINEEYNQNFSFGKFAYSVGFGYGYKTPLGPLRIDYAVPLYGPPNSPVTLEDYQSFANPKLRINDPGWIGTGSFHIALGYAF